MGLASKVISQNRLIEWQSAASADMLRANAVSGGFAANDVEIVEMTLDAFRVAKEAEKPLADVKAAAKDRIDIVAEKVRAKYLTTAPLQAATYVEKACEAREFKAAGYPSSPFSPTTWPYVDAEKRAAGDATPQAACDRILAEAAQYAQVKGAAIEYQRRAGKIAVEAAATLAAVNTAQAAALAALEAL